MLKCFKIYYNKLLCNLYCVRQHQHWRTKKITFAYDSFKNVFHDRSLNIHYHWIEPNKKCSKQLAKRNYQKYHFRSFCTKYLCTSVLCLNYATQKLNNWRGKFAKKSILSIFADRDLKRYQHFALPYKSSFK